ncbi:MAG: hypothetical protein PHY48_03215 [Candidatus Cloacimonetes bacterium]|nr:hypothetical protein [Candidatus Cloacimonadota bacterium]
MQKLKDLDRLHKSYSTLLVSLKNHNIIQAETSTKEILELQDGFWEKVNTYIESATPEIEDLKNKYNDNQAYADVLMPMLLSRSIPVEIDGTKLLIGPMDIEIHVNEHYLQISMGRKKLRVSNLEPGLVVKLIEKTYRKLNSSFNANSFFKRLLKAYGFVNTRMYSSREVKYGFSVALKELFDLFTLSPAASDYKLENFLWDIGRLTATTNFDNYRLELGYSRDVNKMYIIKTASGETIKASTITIHKEVPQDESK